jgi:hypothetical protein
MIYNQLEVINPRRLGEDLSDTVRQMCPGALMEPPIWCSTYILSRGGEDTDKNMHKWLQEVDSNVNCGRLGPAMKEPPAPQGL